MRVTRSHAHTGFFKILFIFKTLQLYECHRGAMVKALELTLTINNYAQFLPFVGSNSSSDEKFLNFKTEKRQ